MSLLIGLGQLKLISEPQSFRPRKHATLGSVSCGTFQARKVALPEVPEINAHQAFEVDPKP